MAITLEEQERKPSYAKYWRPDGWRNPWAQGVIATRDAIVAEGKDPAQSQSLVSLLGHWQQYEMGADAMFEALREQPMLPLGGA